MGFSQRSVIICQAQNMNRRKSAITWCLATALLGAGLPCESFAKGYSSHGGHSYSSHSSSSHGSGFGGGRSSSSGSRSSGGSSSHSSGSKTFSSGSGRSYSSGSIANDSNRKSYSSGKSYSSSDGKTFGAPSRKETPPAAAGTARPSNGDSGGFKFDTTAARARKEEASRESFNQYKQAQNPTPATPDTGLGRVQAPSAGRWGGSSGSTVYVPDRATISTRPIRIYNVFNPYSWRPWVVYRDPYSSLFWWWLLDRSLEDRAWWAYHHHYDMDPARYDALMATDAQLQARVAQLEAQQAARDPNYVPQGLDGRDLMYSDNYVHRAYSNRSTTLGVIAFWAFGIPMALGICALFIWLIWFKRWQTAT